MKFLFSSLDLDVVENFAKRLKTVSIDCELRYPYVVDNGAMHWYPELWIRDDPNFRATSLHVSIPAAATTRTRSNCGTEFLRRVCRLR